MKTQIPKVKDCIAYIESCGWRFKSYYLGGYFFESVDRTTMAGNSNISFTLKELRHAKKYGW